MKSRIWWTVAPVVAFCLMLGGLLYTDAFGHKADEDPDDASTAGRASPGKSLPTPTPTPGADAAAAKASLQAAVEARQDALSELAKKAQALGKKRAETPPVAEFTMANFNTLGASHSRERHMAGGGTRTHRMYDLLKNHHADVVSLQEFQRSQVSTFLRIAGGTYGVFPGLSGRSRDGENAVAWRKDTFDLVKAETRPYPYFGGRTRNMPLVLLRHKATGVEVYVTSYHNPASIRKYGNQSRFRSRGVRAQARDASALVKSTDRALIIAGDMNDRGSYFCAMTGASPMHAANGGSNSGGCRPPHPIWIDWIMGSPKVAFSGYTKVSNGATRRASDHPLLVVRAKVTGKPGDAKSAD